MHNRLKKIAVSVFLLLLFTQDVFSQNTYGITAFGTDQISADQIRATYSKDLDRLLVLYEENINEYKAQRKILAEQLNGQEGFSYVGVYLLKDYVGNFNFIIDFVEKEDAPTRLNFRLVNRVHLDDPDQLISKWMAYEALSNDLFRRGEIRDMKCPVFHCTWAFNHPELKPFFTYFDEHVPENKDKLTNILHHSDDVEFRAAAAFLLAHTDVEADELVNLLLPTIRDPESSVRNNSMRVIYYVVREYECIDLEVNGIIEALDYPSFTDRNKALVILRSLPLTHLSDEQLGRMVPILLEILEKKDAHNYTNGYQVLQKISDKAYAIDDMADWNDWAKSIQN